MLDEEGKLSYFQADEDRKNDIEEIITHSLFSYRVGDTKLKRAAIQAKDATQATLYSGLSDVRAEEIKKNELGDLKNNKAGFKLRDKFGNDELSAMYKLADMIEKNDDSLSFAYGTNKKNTGNGLGKKNKQYAGFANGGDININDLPKVNPIPDVGSITPIPPREMREAFGGPLYQILNPTGKRLIDNLGLRGAGLGGFLEAVVGPGSKFKVSKTAMAKIKPLLQQRKRQLDLSKNIDPVERAAAQKNVKQIEKQIDKIIRDDQS